MIAVKHFVFVLLITVSLPVLANELALESCNNSIKSHDTSISLSNCQGLLAELDSEKFPIITAKFFMILHDIHNELGEKDIAQDYLIQVKNSKGFTDNNEVKYLWNRKIATDHLYNQNYVQAKKHYKSAFVIAQQENNDKWLAISYNDLAIIYKNEEDYLEALDYYQKSLLIKEKLGNDLYIAATLNNLGLVYKLLEKHDESQHYFELALEKSINYTSVNNDKKSLEYLSHIYQSLALIYSINEEHQKQRFYSQKIIDYYQTNISENQTIDSLIVLTRLHLSANEFKPAQQFINQLDQLIDSNEHQLQDEIYLLKSKLALNNKNEIKAIEFVEKSLELSDKKDKSMLKMEIYLYASELYLVSARPYEAMTFLKKYHHLHELLLKQKYSENISIKQSEIENERIAHRLLDQQIVSQNKQQQINELINIILIIFALVLIISFLVSLYVFKKRKNQQHLLTIIESHKQQLFLLNKNEENTTPDSYDNNSLSEVLVAAMHDCLAIWEKSTNTNKVELADRSKIWKISIDEGRLRTRSLDKYLSLKKLPENPRWRNVVKTCHFILSHCELGQNDRDLLTQRLNNIMLIIKNQSMANG